MSLLATMIASLATLSLVCFIAPARAADPVPLAALTGASPCTLIEGVPAPTHPIRKNKTVGPALAAIDRAAHDPVKAARAYDQIVKVVDRLLTTSIGVFEQPTRGRTFAPAPAQRFLSTHVLAANAPLRIGLERFEPAPEVLTMMALAACRAGRVDEVVALGRGTTLAEATPLRAFTALVLIATGRVDEARELEPQLGADGFLAPYVLAELATDPARRAEHHALAGRRRVNPDQDLAWQTQARRFR